MGFISGVRLGRGSEPLSWDKPKEPSSSERSLCSLPGITAGIFGRSVGSPSSWKPLRASPDPQHITARSSLTRYRSPAEQPGEHQPGGNSWNRAGSAANSTRRNVRAGFDSPAPSPCKNPRQASPALPARCCATVNQLWLGSWIGPSPPISAIAGGEGLEGSGQRGEKRR